MGWVFKEKIKGQIPSSYVQNKFQPGIMVHAYKPSALEAEEEGRA